MMLGRHARAQAYQVEMLAGMETLKATGTELRAAEQFSNLFVDELNVSLDEARLAGIVDAASATLRIAAPLTILCFGAHQVLSGTLTLGTMLALHAFSIGVFTPLSNLVSTGVQLQALGSHLERIEDVRRAPLEQAVPGTERLREFRGAIALERVTFRYGPLDPIVVEDISVHIEPGQFVAIVGRSGSGKSTLAGLLVGLYPPTSGRVLYDGVSLSDLNLREVRSKLGIVTQRSYLFHGSIRSNIMMLDPDLPADDMTLAAKLAQIHDEITAMPMAYDTLLADGGSSISGGQRQRICLARALINKPSVVVLDEATSALDATTEYNVQKALETLNCTRIVIAHRLSTIRHANRIVVMDGGKIAEQGTHAELMARNGIYAKLVSSQVEQEG
jgi:ATP-binding cassette, subfamily B, bacterial